MKALVWKEWRENRLIIVWSFALMLVFLVGDLLFERPANIHRIYADELVQLTTWAWFLSALLCGSSMISPEIGSGSLQFLSVLPIARGRVWWTKLAIGLCVLAACLVVSWITSAVFCWIVVAAKVVEPAHYPYRIVDALSACALTLPLYSVGSLVSTLMDRTISALMASIVVAVTLGAAITEAASVAESILEPGHSQFESDSMYVLIVLSVPTLLAMSYIVFTRGETLRTSKRFRLLAGFLLPPVAIGMALVIAWFIIMA